MNKTIINIFSLLTAVCTSLFVACGPNLDDNQGGKAVFPEKTTHTVVPGEEVVFDIESNKPFILTIPQEKRNNFWFDDNGIPERRLSLPAGTHTITVQTAEVTVFENAPVCDITMTIVNESQVVATITLEVGARLFSVYKCQTKDNGEPMKENGNYVYETTPSTSLPMNLIYGSNFELPIKVEANFDWNLDYPDWVLGTIQTNGAAGSTEILIETNEATFPTEGATEAITVKAGSTVLEQFALELSISETKSTAELGGKLSCPFSAEGKYELNDEEQDSYVVTFKSTKGYRVMAVENLGEWYATEEADWVTVTPEAEWDDADGRVQTTTFRVSVTKNEGVSREAAVIFVPESIASESVFGIDRLFNTEGTQIREEFQELVVTVIQDSASGSEFVTANSDLETMYAAGAFFSVSEEEWMKTNFGAKSIFQLTYSNADAHQAALLDLARPCASFKIFNFNEQDVTSNSAYWISVETLEQNKQIRIKMDPTAHNEEEKRAFVGLYDAYENCLAVIDCRYDESATAPVEMTMSLQDEHCGAKLTKMSESHEMYEAIVGNYGVTDIYELKLGINTGVVSAQTFFSVDAWSDDFASDAKSDWLSADPHSDVLIMLSPGRDTENGACALVVFKDENAVNYAAIWVTYDENIQGVSPFELVSSKDATFEQCTEEELQTLRGEFDGVKAINCWKLTYTSAEAEAYIKWPGTPTNGEDFGVSWNNWPASSDYWLSYQEEAKGCKIIMTQTGKTDYFVWKDQQGAFTYVLTCTAAY